MNLNGLPRFIVKKCKGCGADMHHSNHHTLCNNCWTKVHGVKVQNTSSRHSKIDGHSAKYFKAMYETLKSKCGSLENEVNLQKHTIKELQDKITQLKSENLLEDKEIVEKGYLDNLRKKIDNQRIQLKSIEKKNKKLEEEKNEKKA